MLIFLMLPKFLKIMIKIKNIMRKNNLNNSDKTINLNFEFI